MPKIPVNIGDGGAHIDTDLKTLLYAIVDDLNALKAAVEQHTHSANDTPTATTATITTTK